ncbi:thioredoxin family protein [Brevibacillus ginsengisoli]|uniref:thioredoxin family protein n=1 Tax=Brevibacillus ginsengisoli TaxID=363854 RepID=UPI003CF153B0
MKVCTELTEIKESINHHKISLLFIKMAHCGVCDVVFAKTEELLKKYPEINRIAASIEETPELAGEFLVFTAPTILLFAGGKEVLRQSRFVMFNELEDTLKLINEPRGY